MLIPTCQSRKIKALQVQTWYDPAYVPKEWRTINIPGYWEDQGVKDLDGVVWYRREIDVPASMIGKPAKVFLGRIVDADFLYINGTLVGNTTYQYPQRRYAVPAGLFEAREKFICGAGYQQFWQRGICS